MLTTDENIVDLQFVVQYRLMPNGAPDYLFKTSQPDESVRQAAETAMREIVGKKPMDFVLYSGRTEVATEVQTLAQSILDRSEEHTSELQSLMRISYAVFCLKKQKSKHNNTQNNPTHQTTVYNTTNTTLYK